MSLVSAARAEVATTLADLDIPVHTTVPARLVAPCCLLGEGQPFLEAETYGTMLARFQAVLIARPGSNTAVTDQLDQLVSLAITTDPTLVVERYETVTHAGQEYLTAVISLTHPITI